MNKKQLKKLAEDHYYTGKKLTPEEVFLLEQSKYKGIVKKESNFKKIFEYFATPYKEEENSYTAPLRKWKRMRMPSLNRRGVGSLIDEIEEKYGLGIENFSLTKYDTVNLEELKSFIKEYLDKNVLDTTTEKEINDALDSDTVYMLLYKLHSLQ